MSGPFGQGLNSGGPRNSQSLVLDKKEARIGGDDGWGRGPLTRFKDDTTATSNERVDLRNEAEGTVSLDALEKAFPEQFKIADERMKERQSSITEKVRLHVGYDYENDKAYQQWLKDEQERREVLAIHPIDEWLDSMRMQFAYGLRVYTTIGLAYGAYRTHKLWTTIDRNYAKLHGVGIGSIATEQIAYAVCQGAVVGMAWGLGTLAGDNGIRAAECVVSRDIAISRRKWQHVSIACVLGGATSSAAACIIHRKTLTPFGLALLGGTNMLGAMALASYLGPMVYKPFAEAHPKSYYETPRPWYEKEFQKKGPIGVTGRFA